MGWRAIRSISIQLELRDKIDAVNAFVYDNINNGVYKTDFATSQDPYEQGYKAIFVALDEAESMLSTSRYLAGDIITEADRRYLQPWTDLTLCNSDTSNTTKSNWINTPRSLAIYVIYTSNQALRRPSTFTVSSVTTTSVTRWLIQPK